MRYVAVFLLVLWRLLPILAQPNACQRSDGVRPGVAREFVESFGAAVFPSSTLVFKTGCSNYAEDWNIAAQWAAKTTDQYDSVPRTFTLLHLAQWQALRVNEAAGNPVEPNLLVAFVSHFVMSSQFPQYYYRYDALIFSQKEGFEQEEIDLARQAAKPIVVNLLGARLFDGSQKLPTYRPEKPGGPVGKFQNIEGTYLGSDLVQYANARGFVVPFPVEQIPSEEYNALYTAGLLLGGLDSPIRTAYQTQTVYFWFEANRTSGPAGHWNQIALSSSKDVSMSLLESASLLARLNVALYDTFIIIFNQKYKYKRWRPITAIRQGDCPKDLTPENSTCHAPVPDWEPLLPTPNNPVCPSWQGGCGGAAEGILTDWYKAKKKFIIGSEAATPFGRLPGRLYDSFTQASLEVCDSRLYSGVEHSNDAQVGRDYGLQVAQYVLDHFQSLDPTSPFVFDSYKNVQRDFNKTVQTAMEGAANMT